MSHGEHIEDEMRRMQATVEAYEREKREGFVSLAEQRRRAQVQQSPVRPQMQTSAPASTAGGSEWANQPQDAEMTDAPTDVKTTREGSEAQSTANSG